MWNVTTKTVHVCSACACIAVLSVHRDSIPESLSHHWADECSCFAVLSIRGTLSLEDCVTDFMCEPVDLDEWIQEVKQDATPINFHDRLPQVKPAGTNAPLNVAILLLCT